MRILFINQTFAPDVAATAQHAHDLARHLIAHGHEVRVIASRSLYGDRGQALPRREMMNGIEVCRVGRSWFGKASIFARLIDFLQFYLAASLKALTGPRADVVVCFTTPPFISLLGWVMRVLRGSRYVYWVMDLYPDVAVACEVMKPHSLSTRFFDRLNRFCLKRADRVVVLGRCMKQRVLEKNIDPGQVVHIGVWSDAHEVNPMPREENPYRREWNLGDHLVVMYAGNFGLAHDVDTMCGAALALCEDDRFRFVFSGGGKKKSQVERFVKDHHLEQVVIAPYQPRKKLDALLSCADIHLASLREGAEGTIVPCKLFGMLASGRPGIVIGHPDSEISRILIEHECGFVVRPGDVDGLVTTLQQMAEDSDGRTRMGTNARAALKNAYDREQACQQWRDLLEQVVSRTTDNPDELSPRMDTKKARGAA